MVTFVLDTIVHLSRRYREDVGRLLYPLDPHSQCFPSLLKVSKMIILTNLSVIYTYRSHFRHTELTLKVLVTTIDAQWEGMGDVGSARYEPALLPPCSTIRVLRYSN